MVQAKILKVCFTEQPPQRWCVRRRTSLQLVPARVIRKHPKGGGTALISGVVYFPARFLSVGVVDRKESQ